MKFLLFLQMAYVLAFSSAAQSSQLLRVTAQADYSDDGFHNGNIILIDSMHFTYADGHYSNYSFNNFHYENASVVANITTNMTIASLNPNNIDSDALIHVQFDTMALYTPGVVGIQLRDALVATYDLMGKRWEIRQWYGTKPGADTPVCKQTILYSNGRISKVYRFEYTGVAWDTSQVRSVSYNSSGHIVKDSLSADYGGKLSASEYSIYTYNALGSYLTKLTIAKQGNGSFDTSALIANTYYPSGNVATANTKRYINGIWKNYSRDSFNYSTGVPGWTSAYQDVFDQTTGAHLLTRVHQTKRINALGLKDSVTSIVNNPNQTSSPYIGESWSVKYNSSGYPTKFSSYLIDTVGRTYLQGFSHFYYEPYSVGVPSAYSNANCIAVAPNPTTGRIILYHSMPKTNQPLQVSILNSAGQLVRAERFIPAGTQTEIVLGLEAPAGLYTISIRDDKGCLLFSGSILRI